jgi:hypothetical protein
MTNAEKQAAYRRRIEARRKEIISICKHMLENFDAGYDRMNTDGLRRIIELMERK